MKTIKNRTHKRQGEALKAAGYINLDELEHKRKTAAETKAEKTFIAEAAKMYERYDTLIAGTSDPNEKKRLDDQCEDELASLYVNIRKAHGLTF